MIVRFFRTVKLSERGCRYYTKHTGGYLRIKISIGHGGKDWIPHHRYVIEQHIGRKLFFFESVHHKNGNKKDNSLNNLEVWVTKQPKGQRPKDLIEYAKWILKTYTNE